MQLLRLLIVFTFSTSFLSAQYLRSIHIESFQTRHEAVSALIQVNKFVKLHDNILDLQKKYAFQFKFKKTGKYYITLVEPLRKRWVLKELIDTLHLQYPDAYARKLSIVHHQQRVLEYPTNTKIKKVREKLEVKQEKVPVSKLKNLPKKDFLQTLKKDTKKRHKKNNSQYNLYNGMLIVLIIMYIIFMVYYVYKNEVPFTIGFDVRFVFIFFGIVLLFYPILAIFMLAFLMIYEKKFNTIAVLLYVIFFFTLIFYLRLYGPVTSMNGAQDDAIVYLKIFSIFEHYGYINFLRVAKERDIQGLEAIYWLVYYVIGVISNFDRDTYVFFNFFIPISIFITTLRLIFKENYLLAFLLVTTFGYQYYYGMVIWVWRQSLAFSVLVLSLYFIGKNYKKGAMVLLVSTVLIHNSSAIFLFTYSVYLLITSKIKASQALFYFIASIIFGIIILQLYGDALESKHEAYTSGINVGSARLTFIIKFIGGLAISIYMLKKAFQIKDKFLMGVSFFVAFGYTIVLMTMNMLLVNTRLQLTLNLMFLIMIFYYITEYSNYKKNIYIFIHFLVFIIFLRLTQDDNFFSKFLLDAHFNEALIFSVKDFWTLLNTARVY